MTRLSTANTTYYPFNLRWRDRSVGRKGTRSRSGRQNFLLEPLESRLLLSVSLVGIPDWVNQGPTSEVQAGSAVPQNNAVSGALESIAVNPNNSSQIIVGTVNGGVWRTTNANPTNPTAITWTSLTDRLGSLATGAVAYDPADATGNTFYDGTGLWSNSFDSGGTAIGLYRTTDAGATWTLLGNDNTGVNILAGNRIKSLAVNGQTILAGTINGTGIGDLTRPGDPSRDYATLGGSLYRSSDGGATFALDRGTAANPLPAGAVPSVVLDPNNTQRVFAAVAGQGVFRSEDGGATWNAFSTGLASAAGSSDIELTTQNIGGNTTLFVGVSTAGTFNGVFSANNFTGGGNWAALPGPLPAGFNPGAAFAEKFQLIADPANAGVAYIDGQGGTGIFRYNPAGAGSWVQIDAGGAQGTGPHADSRDLRFLGNNTLLESDDGGIYFLQNPTSAATSNWNSFNGNLGTFEFYSLAYDSTNRVIIGGAQDNAVPYQNATNSTSWTQFLGGDGQFQGVDTTSLGGDVLRYSLNNNFGGFQHNRFNNANVQITPAATGGLVTGATNAAPIVITSNNHGLLNGDQVFIGGVQGNTAANFANSVAITVVDANHFSLNGSNGTGSGAYLGDGSWQRVSVITNASGTAGNPVVITANNNHRLNTGDEVFIQGLTGTYAGLNNSSYYVTVTDATHYTLNGTRADGSTAAGGFYSISSSVMLKSAIGAANRSGLNAADAAFTQFSLMPFVLNSVDQRMMLLGFNGLYEDADTTAANGFAGDVITNITANAPGLGGLMSALAYGGRRGGTGFTNVAVVGTTSGQLWFRGETGAAFTNATAQIGTGTVIDSIALDPQDWRRVYVVSNNQVFFTADIANLGTNPFQVIGGGINDNLNGLTSQLRSVKVVGNTPVVGGLGGAFRKIGAVWSEYGEGLPNTVVRDLQYNPTNDVLVAGTFGRGAWTVANASTTIGVTGALQISGDTDFPGEDDTIKLVVDPTNNSLLDVFLNGAESTFQLSTIQQINVNGLGGNDTLIMDDSNGLINVLLGTRYDGGTGFNRLQEVQTGGGTRASDTYSVGPLDGSGVSTIVGSAGRTQQVFFQNLSPVLDTVPAALLTVNATPANNAISYTSAALPTQGKVTIDNQEWIKFSNKTSLVVNTLAGTDTIGINDGSTPTGLTGITINGGDPSAGDTLNVTGVGIATPVIVNTALSTITGATGTGGAVPIKYSNIAALNLPHGIGNLTLNTTAADDTVVVTPGSTTGTGTNNIGTLQSNAAPQISFANNGTLTANLGGGSNALIVNGSQSGDTIDVNGAAVAISGRHTVNYTGVAALTVNGGGGSDRFNVTPSATTAMLIDGGPPIGAGDMLFVISPSGFANFFPGPQPDQGSYVVFGDQPVSFTHIESSLVIFPSDPPDMPNANLPAVVTDAVRGLDGADPSNVTTTASSKRTLPILRNYTNADTLTGLGLAGSDTSNVTTAASGWGLLSGNKQSTDNLKVLYAPPWLRIIQSIATQDPDPGLVDSTYGMADFLAQYSDIEQMVISKA